MIFPHDLLVVAAREFENRENLTLKEITVEKSSKWNGKSLEELELGQGTLIVMIQCDKETIIPRGSTKIEEGGLLVAAKF